MESNNNNFSNWPKKTRGICKPKTTKNTSLSISCTYIIPSNNDTFLNHQEIISSPIPSGHLETSTRFWQFRVEEGRTTYVRYGNIRADGSFKERATHIQQHLNYVDAKKFVENLVDEKIKAGYVGWARW
ncbi:11956_t:CDS:1 [Diversispora eburnea]|uniref:11956_t:CDS:1 n=1 Tax=Diversispora eburnea TaxID=1213867 RepID=A0A9N8VQQ2_9GLOM|nr:11956_t:CDS:1 [Diversispora eburnea]